jgi:phage shock protein C
MSESKRLFRNQSNRVIGGVCAGLGRYLGVDPVLVRLVFVALALVNGLGVLAYLVMWLIVPDETSGEKTGEELFRANVDDMGRQARHLGETFKATPHSGVIIGVVLVAVGGMFLLGNFVDWVSPAIIWSCALIALGAYFLLTRR